jgi:ribosomal protein L32E
MVRIVRPGGAITTELEVMLSKDDPAVMMRLGMKHEKDNVKRMKTMHWRRVGDDWDRPQEEVNKKTDLDDKDDEMT